MDKKDNYDNQGLHNAQNKEINEQPLKDVPTVTKPNGVLLKKFVIALGFNLIILNGNRDTGKQCKA